MSGLLGVPVDAAYHLVFALTHLLTPVAGGLAAAAAIVLFTAAVRLLISPLSFRALRGQAAMARLAPQVQALRARHARQPERLGRELTALYEREGSSPFAGFLPLLAQWPFLTVTYLLFRSGTVDGAQNQLLSDGLFGVPLGAHWLSGAGLLSVHDALFLAVLAVLAVLCWLSARTARRAAPARWRPPPRPGARASGPPFPRGPGSPAARARPPLAPARPTPRRRPGGGADRPGGPVRDRGLRRVRAPGRRALPAHHRRLDPWRAPPVPAQGRAGRQAPRRWPGRAGRRHRARAPSPAPGGEASGASGRRARPLRACGRWRTT